MLNIEHPLYQNDLENMVRDITFPDTCCILITGATGLIGSAAVDAIMHLNERAEKHIEVYILGRSLHRLEQRFGYWIKRDSGIYLHFIEGDVCSKDFLTYNFDYILHAASNADPRAYAVEPVETILTNVKGACNILDYAKERQVRVLFTSSFEVNGFIEGRDVYSENMYGLIDCTRIRAGYPESKRIAELLFRSYGEEYHVEFVIARLSSIYGPTMNKSDSKAHAQFICNALNGDVITMKSEGAQRRTYTYVADAVNGLLYLLFKSEFTGIYNVANGRSVASIAEVAKIIGEISEKQIVYKLPDSVEAKGFSTPQNCILDTTVFENAGWHGIYGLRDGLERTLRILGDNTMSVIKA